MSKCREHNKFRDMSYYDNVKGLHSGVALFFSGADRLKCYLLTTLLANRRAEHLGKGLLAAIINPVIFFKFKMMAVSFGGNPDLVQWRLFIDNDL